MNVTISPGQLHGTVHAIASKSVAHRILICSAFADRETILDCPETNDDIEATASCLRSLGASVIRTPTGYRVIPAEAVPPKALLHCGESGSTLRFLLPVAGALGVEATFRLAGRLPQRPLSPLWEEMERMGCTLSRPTEDTLLCRGKLRAGSYRIDPGISSQFVSGLLFAMALMKGSSRLTLCGKAESQPYIAMTRDALSRFGVRTEDYAVTENHHLVSPGTVKVEGDWSNAAFFLAAKALGSDLTVTNLNPGSAQGDRAVVDVLERLNAFSRIDAADIPDLVPVLAVAAGAKSGAVFRNIRRLRLKESDRVESVCAMIRSLGGRAESTENTLTVYPTGYSGGTVDSAGDHRIAMSAAIAATVATGPVTVLEAQCVRKSYPDFWNVYQQLGGKL